MRPDILLLDNYDSFTYNIAQAFGSLGAAVDVVRADAIGGTSVAEQRPRGIVISPGPGIPQNAGASMDIVASCSGDIPILGICLGHQVIAAVFGGRVVRGAVPMHGKCSSITHDGSRLFDRVPSPLRATRYHSLVVEEGSLRTTPLRIVARSDDHVVMGIAHATHQTYGVQFHPESVLSEHGLHLLSNFLAIAREAA